MTADELEKKFVDADIPAGIVATPGRLLRSEHLWENGYLVKMPVHGIDGPVPYMGFPVKLSAHPDIEYKAAPVLGGDNEDIYGHVRQEQRRARRAEKEKRNLKTER